MFGRDLFRNPGFDAPRFRADLERPPAPRMFGIFFTPRSGSSWLSDILARTGLLGQPMEWFNPALVPDQARAVNARDLEGYVRMLRRKRQAGGVFSFETTIYQMRRVFRAEARYLSHFPAEMPLFYLTRGDMVLQAVSLAKAVKTSVFHSPQASAEDVAAAETGFAYRARAIAHWLEHVFDQERRCETFFARHAITPQRLSYETITGAGAEQTARLFLRRLRPEAADRALPDLASPYVKIATAQNRDYAERFRRSHPRTVARIEAFRAGLPAPGVPPAR